MVFFFKEKVWQIYELKPFKTQNREKNEWKSNTIFIKESFMEKKLLKCIKKKKEIQISIKSLKGKIGRKKNWNWKCNEKNNLFKWVELTKKNCFPTFSLKRTL